MLTTRGLGTVLRDLATMGYDAQWCVLGANDVGANHKRDRIWLLAHSNSKSDAKRGSNRNISKISGQWNFDQKRSRRNDDGIFKSTTNEEMDTESRHSIREFANTGSKGLERGGKDWEKNYENRENSELWGAIAERSWWATEPNVGRVVDGVAARVDRLKAIGNGQVPLCAATAWNILKGRIDDKS